MRKIKGGKAAVWACAICSFGLVVGLAACSPSTSSDSSGGSKKDDSATTTTTQVVETPEADSYGVVVADSWKDIYPNQYNTYMENESNSPDSGKHNYLELYPALNTMYKGYAFALGYDEASSHLYSLTSVKETPRTVKKEQLANCITCKTPQFTALVREQGDTVYLTKFNDLVNDFTEPISCWNCHENDPTSLKVGNTFFTEALGKDATNYSKAPLEAQVCGQCHNEYYFSGDNKVPTNPYSGLDEMTPDAILAYYDAKGYSDWKHADTLAPMIKVQHPEFETVYGGEQSEGMAKMGYACSDCHMGTTTASDGSEYTSHNWVSPLENKELLENECNKCHKDLKSEVEAIQAEEEERVTAISEKIEDMTNKIASTYAEEIAQIKAAQEAGNTQDASEGLQQLWTLQRNAQFYWDFVMVENSEGAHNSTLTTETLDKAEAAVDEALSLLA